MAGIDMHNVISVTLKPIYQLGGGGSWVRDIVVESKGVAGGHEEVEITMFASAKEKLEVEIEG